ncbi:BA75_04976T0 [Komagataella pastoris]|uniref:BA75_04976T0 n=1 Tax=Komagataella pastoris TaxID=4922 RepID=A0A1B2JID1_PICPA|nr:BA75_04976T0 [Komagataella pastoris]
MKRKQNGQGKDRKKRYKPGANGIVEPGQYGIFATCVRGKERACLSELTELVIDKVNEYYDEDLYKQQKDEDEDKEEKSDGEEVKDKSAVSIEESIKLELQEMSESKKGNSTLISGVELGTECFVFVKMKKPLVPSQFATKLVQELFDNKRKATKFTLRLSPVDGSCSGTLPELTKLAQRLLKPHFHQEKEVQKPLKFAIQVNRRNFSVLEKLDVIKTVASCVGNEGGHKVDLKDYDILILVECFKNNISMSVLDGKVYDKCKRFNLQEVLNVK